MPKKIYLEKVYPDNEGRMIYHNVACNEWYKDITKNKDVQRPQDLHLFNKEGEPVKPLSSDIQLHVIKEVILIEE